MAAETTVQKIPAFTLKTKSYQGDMDSERTDESSFNSMGEVRPLLDQISRYKATGELINDSRLSEMIGSCFMSGEPNWLDSAYLYEYVPNEHSFKITRL